MIDRIIKYSIEHKLIIGILIVGLIGWGLYSLRQLPIDAVPDITNNQVQVITVSPNLAAPEVEAFITFPVEQAMQNLPGIEEIRSISRFGLSVVTVVFGDDMGTYLPRQLVSEQLSNLTASIPEGMGKPEMAPISTGLGEILQYVLHPTDGFEDKYSPMELRTIQDWIVKRQLSGTPGVVEVNSFGGYLKEYEVAVDPDRLNSLGLSLREVYDAVQQGNGNIGGAYIERGTNAYFIRGEGMVDSLEGIRKIVIENRDGVPVTVADAAEVRYGHAPRFGAMTRNGKGEVVGGIVLMLKGENSAQVIDRVKTRVAEIQKSLPEGLVIEPYLDRSKLVENAVNTVAKNLIEGGIIVILVLVIMLGNFRAGLVVASVIPLAMLFAFSMMHLFGVSANLMSLGAIDFGLIVDGAVIVVEAIVHRLHTQGAGVRLTASQMNAEVFTASARIRKSAAFGEIIILVVYLPILALSGIEGKMFKPMAQTVAFAILGALILSLTYVPMMSSLVLSRKTSQRVTIADRIISFLQKLYRPALELALKARLWFVTGTLAVFIFSLLTFMRMGGEFIPTLEEGDFALHQILPAGSSLSESVKISGKLQKMLLANFPEIEQIVTKIGTAEIPTDPMSMETGDIMVIMKDKSEWTTAETKEEMFEKMEALMSKLPGIEYEFTQPIQMRFNELMTGVRQDIAIKIFGEDLDMLHKKAKETEQIVSSIAGVGDVQVERVTGLPQINIKYNRSKMAQYGLRVADINFAIETSFAGQVAGVVLEGEKRFNLTVRLDTANRKGIEDIRSLLIDLPDGGKIPLKDVAAVDLIEAPMQVSRENAKRRITIGINARNRDTESLVKEIQETLEQQLELPPGYFLSYGGQFENLQAAKQRLSIAVPIALLLIFVLLYLTFGSVKHAILIFTAIPLSAIGGIWALYFRGMPFSISAGVGFIALFGVSVLNGIVLISYLNQLKEEGMENVFDRIREATKVRMRPVMMTAAVASMGFLPMALSNSAGAEVQKPLATVVIGGLITSTLLTLVILPVLYSFFERVSLKPGRTAAGVLAFLLVAGAGLNARAQQPRSVSFEEMLDVKVKAFPDAEVAELEVKKAEAGKKGIFTLPPTDFGFTWGQMNTSVMDRYFSVSQEITFPTQFKNRKAVYESEVKVAEAEARSKMQELKYKAALAYMSTVHLKQRLSYLQARFLAADTLQAIASLREQAGDLSALERELVAYGWREAKANRDAARLELETARIRLGMYSGEETAEGREDSLQALLAHLPAPLEAGGDSPETAVLKARENARTRMAGAANSQRTPALNIGYFNQTLDGAPGFQGATFGVSIPLFRSGAKVQRDVHAAWAEQYRASYHSSIYRYQTAFQQLKEREAGLKEIIQIKAEAASGDQLLRLIRKAWEAGEVDLTQYFRYLDKEVALDLELLDLWQELITVRLQRLYLSGNL